MKPNKTLMGFVCQTLAQRSSAQSWKRSSEPPKGPSNLSLSHLGVGGHDTIVGRGCLSPHNWPSLLFFFWPEGPSCHGAKGPLKPVMTLGRSRIKLGGTKVWNHFKEAWDTPEAALSLAAVGMRGSRQSQGPNLPNGGVKSPASREEFLKAIISCSLYLCPPFLKCETHL